MLIKFWFPRGEKGPGNTSVLHDTTSSPALRTRLCRTICPTFTLCKQTRKASQLSSSWNNPTVLSRCASPKQKKNRVCKHHKFPPTFLNDQFHTSLPSPVTFLSVWRKPRTAGNGTSSTAHSIRSFTPVSWHMWNTSTYQWRDGSEASEVGTGACRLLQISHHCIWAWHLIFKRNCKLCTQG